RIEEPRKCRRQLEEALAMDGPVVVEAVVDPLEPPEPPKITKDEAEKLAKALARGEPNAVRIGLSIGRSMVRESTYPASPFGVPARALGVTHEEGPTKKHTVAKLAAGAGVAAVAGLLLAKR